MVASESLQDLSAILHQVPEGKRKTVHSSPLSTQMIYSIVYTRGIHDIYSVVYTEVTDSQQALVIYQTYSPLLSPGGKLIYYIDYHRHQVNVALHTISSEEFEITYYRFFIVFTKLDDACTTCESLDSEVQDYEKKEHVDVPRPLTLSHFWTA